MNQFRHVFGQCHSNKEKVSTLNVYLAMRVVGI